MEQGLDRWFFVIHRSRHAFLRDRFSDLDIETRLLPFLLFLADNEGVRQEDLSRETGLDKTTVAHSLKRLVQTGYVTRERNPSDRRCYRLTLTRKGTDLVPLVRQAMEAWHTGVLATLSTGDRTQLEGFLRRMAESAMALAGRSIR